ncbi:MAG: cytidine deaminase [Tannerella sp.]|nr:cytidine deaminase [Tannerella sp.]
MNSGQTIEIAFRAHRTDNNDLSDEMLRLKTLAVDAARKAYAPYSRLRVGAVAVLADGTTVTANNQENAAYPSGMCAERVALYAAGANYPDTAVRMLAVVALDGEAVHDLIAPCGACRQVLLETEQRQGVAVRVVMFGIDETVSVDSAAALLPLAFRL